MYSCFISPEEKENIKHLEDIVESSTLPSGVYATVLRDDVRSPVFPPVIVVWTDRVYERCPVCGEHVDQDMSSHSFLNLNQGNVESFSQQHNCGIWMTNYWEIVYPNEWRDVSSEDVEDMADRLLDLLHDEREKNRRRVKKGLYRDLKNALERLNEPLEEDETQEDRAEEVRTGNEVNPGVYRDGHWLAWYYDPDGSGDLVEVHEFEVFPRKVSHAG